MKMIRWALLCALTTATSALPIAAQDNDKVCSIAALDDGRVFPVTVRLNPGKKGQAWEFYGNGKKNRPTELSRLPAGTHLVETVHYRLGFPQPVAYRVVNSAGKTLWESEATLDPRRVTLEKGDKLVVLVKRPMESYNAKFFTLRGVDMAVVFPRPYAYQDIQPGRFKGKEDFPNSLFYLVHKDWGAKKVFTDLADFAVEELMKDKEIGEAGDYRKHHASLLIALAPDGKIPADLKKAGKDGLKADIADALGKAFDTMKKEKCYRPYADADITALKKMKALPEAFDGNIVTFAEGLEMAERLLPLWQKMKDAEAKKAKDK